MRDFTPLCEIVTVGYQLNDGTHVHANSPFADRKLSWKAAILVQQRTVGEGSGGWWRVWWLKGWWWGGCSTNWDSWCFQIVIIWHKPDTGNHFSRLRENKMDTVRKHTKTGFTCEGRLNIAMWYGLWQSEACSRHCEKASWGIACYRGKRCEIWLQLSDTKGWICSTGVSSEW